MAKRIISEIEELNHEQGVTHGMACGKNKTSASLGSLGCVDALLFSSGGLARVTLHATDLARILDAIEALESQKKKKDENALQAIALLRKRLNSAAHASSQIHMHSVIAQHGVTLEPIDVEMR